MGFTFKPDPKAPAEIARSKSWARYVGAIAKLAAESAIVVFEAQGPHPYSDEPEHYVNKIEPGVVFENGVVAGRVTAGASYSIYIEHGTSDTPTFAPLQRGADAIGLRVEAKHGTG